MNKPLKLLFFALILIASAVLVPNSPFAGEAEAQSIGTCISINSDLHDFYGMSYPVTYKFSIPSALSSGKCYHRHDTTSSWVQLTSTESTSPSEPTTLYMGNECARWDYTNDFVYVSVSFDTDSDDIYIKITDSSDNLQSATLLYPTTYYDNRKCSVSALGDGWCNPSCSDTYCPARPNAWPDLADTWQNYHIYGTAGIDTNNGGEPDWEEIQAQIDEGYLEVASQGVSHGYPNSWSESTSNYEIGSSSATIKAELDLPSFQKSGTTEYVYAWLAPHGQITSNDMTHFGEYYYLCSRWYTIYCGANSFQSWNSGYETYNSSGVTFWYHTATCGDTDCCFVTTSKANSYFDDAYNNGQVYAFATHPDLAGDLSDPDGWYNQHLNYINDKKDVWYVPWGVLYLYHFTASNVILPEYETLTYTANKDTLISEASIYSNYGTQTYLGLCDNPTGITRYRTLLEFDTSFAGDVAEAHLSLYYYDWDSHDPADEPIDVCKLTDDTWTETSACWTYKSAPTKLIGTSTAGGTSTAQNYIDCCKFQASSSGTVTAIRVYCASTVSVKVAIYDDDGSSGEPGTQLGVNNSGTACSSGWNYVPLSSGVSINSGEYYYLAYVASAAQVRAQYTGSGNVRRFKASSYSGGLPSTWPTASDTHDATYYLSLDGSAVSFWSSAGGDYTESSPSKASEGVPGSYGWMVFDVTQIVKDAVDNNEGLVEILVKFATEDNDPSAAMWYYSDEYATSSYRPKLEIYAEVGIYTYPISHDFGGVVSGSTLWTNDSTPIFSPNIDDNECWGNLTNSGGVETDVEIKIDGNWTGNTNWENVSTSPGANECRVTAYVSGGNSTSGLVLTTSYQTFIASLSTDDYSMWEIKVEFGNLTQEYDEHTTTVSLIASDICEITVDLSAGVFAITTLPATSVKSTSAILWGNNAGEMDTDYVAVWWGNESASLPTSMAKGDWDNYYAWEETNTQGQTFYYQIAVGNLTSEKCYWTVAGGNSTSGDVDCGACVWFCTSSTSHDFGTVTPSNSYESGLTQFLFRNCSDGNITVTIGSSQWVGVGGTNWTPSDDGNPGTNIIGLYAGLSGGSYSVVVRYTAPFNILVSNMGNGTYQEYGIKLYSPTNEATDGVVKHGNITLYMEAL